MENQQSERHPAQAAYDILGREFAQVGFVVEDLDSALCAHAGLGPWSVYTYDTRSVPTLRADVAHGEDFGIRLALNPTSPQLELIQPLDAIGPHGRWLVEHGPGIHHLGFLVEDVAAATRAMTDAGFDVIVSGSGYGADGDGGFCYFDTREAVGYVMEAIERPKRRRPPEAIHP